MQVGGGARQSMCGLSASTTCAGRKSAGMLCVETFNMCGPAEGLLSRYAMTCL